MMNTSVIRVLSVAIVLLVVSFPVQPQTLVSMKGKWTLTTLRDGQTREIKFDTIKGQLWGEYKASNGNVYPITSAKLTRGSLSFRVVAAGLYFELKSIGSTRFEGRMLTASKKTPEPVQLTKVQ